MISARARAQSLAWASCTVFVSSSMGRGGALGRWVVARRLPAHIMGHARLGGDAFLLALRSHGTARPTDHLLETEYVKVFSPLPLPLLSPCPLDPSPSRPSPSPSPSPASHLEADSSGCRIRDDGDLRGEACNGKRQGEWSLCWYSIRQLLPMKCEIVKPNPHCPSHHPLRPFQSTELGCGTFIRALKVSFLASNGHGAEHPMSSAYIHVWGRPTCCWPRPYLLLQLWQKLCLLHSQLNCPPHPPAFPLP